MPTESLDEQSVVRCVLMRGGTSKALFFHEADVPPASPARDSLLKRAMGTPDVLQIDGTGGSRLVTSKVAIIQKSTRPDADIDYTFAQIDVERDLIGYDANCGNISSAVAPFAIDEGLVEAVEPVTTVRISRSTSLRAATASPRTWRWSYWRSRQASSSTTSRTRARRLPSTTSWRGRCP
ncbi:proline racemase family protein [Variovorax paradoxus]|nr:proline racemase family protein [Variovorax paradoxus]